VIGYPLKLLSGAQLKRPDESGRGKHECLRHVWLRPYAPTRAGSSFSISETNAFASPNNIRVRSM
jgi:hypothetical protein